MAKCYWIIVSKREVFYAVSINKMDITTNIRKNDSLETVPVK